MPHPIKLTAAALLLLGLLTFMVALPCLMADIALVAGNETHDALTLHKTISDEELDRFENSRVRALFWRPTNQILDDLAMAEFAKAQAEIPPRRQSLRKVIDFQEQALVLSPADTYGWARLTYAHLLIDGPSIGIAHMFEHSLEAAPYEPRLALSRMSTAMLLQGRLSSDVEANIPDLIKQAWKQDGTAVIKAAREGSFLHQVEVALRSDPLMAAQFKNLNY